jgi:hypothetical protein
LTTAVQVVATTERGGGDPPATLAHSLALSRGFVNKRSTPQSDVVFTGIRTTHESVSRFAAHVRPRLLSVDVEASA